jgi:aminomethyltransferase
LSEILNRTALHDEHVRLAARIVPFAGYSMPVQYPTGVLTEHNWTREQAGLFDVSHMGQATLRGPDFETTAKALEQLVPADVLGLMPLQQRYSQLLNEVGGIIDDLMIIRGRKDGEIYLVVNAGCKDKDYAWITSHLPPDVTLHARNDLALMALQGPMAEAVLSKLAPACTVMAFMQAAEVHIADIPAFVTRSGYTGEDGFGISVHEKDAVKLWHLLLQDQRVKPIGLGARDSLRLESGLCLYGHELDDTTSPNEAALMWSIAKRRREDGGFIGATRVQAELKNGVKRVRVGIKPDGRAPARDGTIIQDAEGRAVGHITSGGFGLHSAHFSNTWHTSATHRPRQGLAGNGRQTAFRSQPLQTITRKYHEQEIHDRT